MNTKQLIKDLTLVGVGISALALISLSPVLAYAAEAPAAVPVSATSQDNVQSTGQFEGRSKHVTSGQVTILKTSNGYELLLGDDFFLDGAPSPVLGFGNNGTYDKASTFAKLEKKNGRQVYTLPEGFTPSNFNQVFVWCEDFSVPLGVASLS